MENEMGIHGRANGARFANFYLRGYSTIEALLARVE